jgi:hypothetical protein
VDDLDDGTAILHIGIYTVIDVKITEAWFADDMLGALTQLGAMNLR